MIIKSGTNNSVGPGLYKVTKKFSENNSPKWGIGYGEKNSLKKNISQSDEYYIYEYLCCIFMLVRLGSNVNRDASLYQLLRLRKQIEMILARLLFLLREKNKQFF